VRYSLTISIRLSITSAAEPVGLLQDAPEINLRNVRVQVWHFRSGPTCPAVKMDQAVRWFYAPDYTALKPLLVCLGVSVKWLSSVSINEVPCVV